MSAPYREPPPTRRRRPVQRCPVCKLVSPGSALRCDCGYEFATGARAPSAARRRLEWDLKQQAGSLFIGLFVGGVIAPILLIFDTGRPWHGWFLLIVSIPLVLLGARAWFKLPRDQRRWKALRAPRDGKPDPR